MNINVNSEDAIILICIGIAIGVAIGFVIKTFVDSYVLIKGLPL